MIMVRLTRETWFEFFKMYRNNAFPNQRLGQAAVNYFDLTDQSYLFYVQSEKKAYEYINKLMKDYQL